MPNSQGAKGAEHPPSTCTGRSAKREARGPERRRVGGSPSDPERGVGGCEGRPPQKRKVLRSLMFFDHFEAPCGFGISFSAFNSRWELLLFRALFLTPNAALPGLRWKNPVYLASLFLGDPNHWKTLSYRALRNSGPTKITKY